jgi:hypothetical protein
MLFVRCTLHIQCTAGPSGNRIITEYTHHEYCEKLYTLGSCNSRAGTDGREFPPLHSGWRHPHPLMCFSDYRRVSVSHEMRVYSTCEWNSSTDFAETYRLMCHNCSCGTTAVLLTRYRRKIGNIPSEDTWPSFGSTPLLAELTSFYRCLSSKSILCVGWLQGAYGLIFWYVAPLDRDSCLEKQTSQDACCIKYSTYYFNTCTLHLFLFCTMNKQMHNWLTDYHTSPNVSTLLCHPRGVRSQYLAKLHKFVRCISW